MRGTPHPDYDTPVTGAIQGAAAVNASPAAQAAAAAVRSVRRLPDGAETAASRAMSPAGIRTIAIASGTRTDKDSPYPSPNHANSRPVNASTSG